MDKAKILQTMKKTEEKQSFEGICDLSAKDVLFQ